jgi:hypothetical protein
LFQRFANIWPRDWADKCALGNLDAIAHEWSIGLAGMSGTQLARAVDHCRRTMIWSPTIAEFRQAAKQGLSDEQRAFLGRQDGEQPRLPTRTWTESRAAGARQARAAKRYTRQEITRSLANIASGAWTPEMEARYAQDCALLALAYRAPEWPEAGSPAGASSGPDVSRTRGAEADPDAHVE